MFGQVLTLSILRLASAQLAEVFTVADKDAAVDFLSALQAEDGSFGDALDNYYAACASAGCRGPQRGTAL